MPNRSKTKKKDKKEVAKDFKNGWYILRLDGSSFSAFRVPKMDQSSLEEFYNIMSSTCKDVIEKYWFINFAYVNDDEIYLCFKSENIFKKLNEMFKLATLISGFVSARFNYHLNNTNIDSELTLKHNMYTFDARYIHLKKENIYRYIKKKIDLGKLHLGNLLTGAGSGFLNLNMDKIKLVAKEKSINIDRDYYLLFGLFISKENTISYQDKKLSEFKMIVQREIKNCLPAAQN